MVHAHIITKLNFGRGLNSTFTAKDDLFMTLKVLKNVGQWDFVGTMFRIKGKTLERLIMKFIPCFDGFLVASLIVGVADAYPMSHLLKEKMVFKYHPYVCYATDVTFQQCNLPSRKFRRGQEVILRKESHLRLRAGGVRFAELVGYLIQQALLGIYL